MPCCPTYAASRTKARYSCRSLRARPSSISRAISDLRPEIVVLAVKPQTMDAVLPDLRRFADEGAVFLSIAAGKTLKYFASHLRSEARDRRAGGEAADHGCRAARPTPLRGRRRGIPVDRCGQDPQVFREPSQI